LVPQNTLKKTLSAVLTRLLAAFDCKAHEMVLKIKVSCLWL